MGSREKRWIDSDLVGIPATLYTFGVLVVSLALFRYASPIAGVVIAVGLWVPMFVFAIRERGYPEAPLRIRQADGSRHRVLVIANQGLEDPKLCEEICHQSGRSATEAMIVAPVVASSRLRDLANDVDRELALAGRRVSSALQELHAAGVHADGRVDVAVPMESLLDGLREFAANEIVILPGGDAQARHGGDWAAASALAERVHSEAGLAVTEFN
jgi:hypothetical protein